MHAERTVLCTRMCVFSPHVYMNTWVFMCMRTHVCACMCECAHVCCTVHMLAYVVCMLRRGLGGELSYPGVWDSHALCGWRVLWVRSAQPGVALAQPSSECFSSVSPLLWGTQTLSAMSWA